MKFKILIDTSTDQCLVALVAQAKVLDYTHFKGRDVKTTFSSILEQLIAKNSLSLKDLESIACSRGPGYFTGIRLGLAFAQGLAFANNVPLQTFSSLTGFVSEEEGVFVSLIDAKSKGFYCLTRERKKEAILNLSEPKVVSHKELKDLLSDRPVVVGPSFPVQGVEGVSTVPNPFYLSRYLAQNPEEIGEKPLYLTSPLLTGSPESSE